MKINGIGIISKAEAMSVLTADGRQAVKEGMITDAELGEMYKLEMVRRWLREHPELVLLETHSGTHTSGSRIH